MIKCSLILYQNKGLVFISSTGTIYLIKKIRKKKIQIETRNL
jgi:hypothetical protein